MGWTLGQQQMADLVIQTLNMAPITRKPQNIIHRSDEGPSVTWIKGWYYPRRRRKSLGRKSHINFEKELHDKAADTIPTVTGPPSAGEPKTEAAGVREIRVSPRPAI